MKHALRKYISNSGSALFMVVSTMAALIMLVTAMYLSVLSAGRVQYTTFSSEQAYVTSTSIGDMVSAYITGGDNASLKSAIEALTVGGSISTNGNNFEAFGGTAEDDPRLGAYDVTITYVYDIGDLKVYDIAVTVDNNGALQTTHTRFNILPQTTKLRRIDNFFTATGYLPNDIWIQQMETSSKVYFDNEYVTISQYGIGSIAAGQMEYDFDITALGTLEIDEGKNYSETLPEALTWIIGNDFIMSAQSVDIKLGESSADTGILYVNRDLRLDTSAVNVDFNNAIVYVMGDLYINTNTTVSGGTKIYVAGNVYQNASFGGVLGTTCFVGGTLYDSYGNATAGGGLPATAIDQAMELCAKLEPSSWARWSVAGDNTEVTLDFEANIPAGEDKMNYGSKYVVIDRDCTLPEQWTNWGTQDKPHYFIIDTGDDPAGIITITLPENGNQFDYDGDYKYKDSEGNPIKVFKWCAGNAVNAPTYVLTVGKGTLVINVPDDVVYQTQYNVFVGHIAWFTAFGGEITINNGVPVFKHNNAHETACDNATKLTNEKGLLITESNTKAYGETGACNYQLVVDSIELADFPEYTVQSEETDGNKYVTLPVDSADRDNNKFIIPTQTDDGQPYNQPADWQIKYATDSNGAIVRDEEGYPTISDAGLRCYWTCTEHGGWYDVDNIKKLKDKLTDIDDREDNGPSDKEDAATLGVSDGVPRNAGHTYLDITEEEAACQEITDYKNGDKSLCIGRINTKGFDSFYSGDGSSAKTSLNTFYGWYAGGKYNDGTFIYPNVNIYLASDDENASIYIGISDYETQVTHAFYFGYIYAPYMTYTLATTGNESSDGAHGMGGLVVSDIILGAGMNFIYAQPDISITGIEGPDWEGLIALTDKSWAYGYGQRK